MPRAHALLGASSAHRWLHCTPCSRLEEQFPDTTSTYALEGTLAHEIAELKLRKQFTEPMSAKAFATRMNKLKKHELYREEMQEHTDAYVEYVTECAMRYDSAPTVAVETRLDYSDWAPEGFGTGDCILIGGDTLQITDFKYGSGKPVSAVGNEQMRLYALGALKLYGMIYPIRRARMAIVQPRLSSITEDEMTVDELLHWAEQTVRPAAALAYEGAGEYCAGEWCGFCRARAQCRARAENNLSVIEDFGSPPKLLPLLSDEELGQALLRAEPFVKWFNAMEGFALDAVLKGREITGWKAVEGRSNRAFGDMDAAFNALRAAGFNEALLYERKPITLTAAEKLAGKKEFADLCGAYIIKPPGRPTLVMETDARPPYNGAAADFAGINNTEGE